MTDKLDRLLELRGMNSVYKPEYESLKSELEAQLEKVEKWDSFISNLEYEHGWFYFKKEVNESVHIAITLSEKKQCAYSYGLPFRLGESNKDTIKEYKITADQCGLKLDSLVKEPLGSELQKSIEKIERLKDHFCKQSIEYDQKNRKLESKVSKLEEENNSLGDLLQKQGHLNKQYKSTIDEIKKWREDEAYTGIGNKEWNELKAILERSDTPDKLGEKK